MLTTVDCLPWTQNVPTTSLGDLLSGQAFSNNTPLNKESQRWFVPLTNLDEHLDACVDLITEAEKIRMERFRHEGARVQFLVGHAVIHLLLKQYLGNEYQSIRWMESEHHKPFIQLENGSKPLEYNLSHCKGFIAVAVGHRSQGIDIEQNRHLKDLEGISRQVFTEEEIAQVFDTTDPEKQNQTFFKFWTCKEAALKAHGTGFMKDPKTLQLHFPSELKEANNAVVWSDSIPGYSTAWTEAD